MTDSPTTDELVQTLTVPGAMLVADACVYDPAHMEKIALKVLAHEVRRLREFEWMYKELQS